jgi:DNA-binding transcriptional MerR regulator
MKLAKETLKRIIKEELASVLRESEYSSLEEYIKSRGPLEQITDPLSAWGNMSFEMIDALDAIGFVDHISNKDRKLLVQWLSTLGVSEKEIKDYLSKLIKSEKKKAKVAALDNKLVQLMKNEIEMQRKKRSSGGYYVEFNGDQIDFYIGIFADDGNYSDEEVREAVSILSKEMPNINFIYEI